MKKINLDQNLCEAMVNYQYLEFMLQGAISHFESIIEHKVSGIMQYPVNVNNINNLGLCKLAELYGKYTGDSNFKERVKRIARSRNKLAHALFLNAENFDDPDLREVNIESEVNEVLKQSLLADCMASEIIMYMQNIFDPSVEEFEKILKEANGDAN